MISATRSPFVEQPNGDLVCTLTIPASHRVAALSGEAFVLPLSPGAVRKPAADGEGFTVDLQSVAVDEKPPPQVLGVSGQDQSHVLEAAEIASWDHPAAAFWMQLPLYAPFQAFTATLSAPLSEWESPIQATVRVLRDRTTGMDREQTLKTLEAMLADYEAWATEKGLPIWPEAT